MNSLDFLERAISLASKEFIRGFVIGQLALFVLFLVLARILLFSGSQEAARPSRHPAPLEKTRRRADEDLGLGLNSIKEGLGLAATARRESCLWLNVIAGRLILEPLREFVLQKSIIRRFSILLSTHATNATEMLGPVEISRVTLGDTNPLVRWIAINDASDALEVQIEWQDAASVELETSLVLRWPPCQPLAHLPCSLALLLPRLIFSLRIELGKSGSGDEKVRVSLLDEGLQMDLDIRSLIGHRSKLKDVPKVTAVLQSRIRRALESILHPRYMELDVGGEVRRTLERLVATRLPADKWHEE